MGVSVDVLLNGKDVRLSATGDEPLLFALRNRLGLTATHFGCGLEQCGACVVSVDGAVRYACTLSIGDLAGAKILTAEALPKDPVGKALLRAFADESAGQCGYCLAGILMSALVLLKTDPAPSRATIVAALDKHLCRCGSHGHILRAVERAAAALSPADHAAPLP